MLDLSIVIVSWNTKSLLINCLESIAQQTGSFKVEVVVVDNASSDGSPEKAASQFPDVKLVVNKDNLGFARANNIGIEQTSGRYIALVNSDVVLLPECIEKLIGFMDQHPGVGVVGPRILNSDGIVQPSSRKFPTFLSCVFRTFALDRLFPQSAGFKESFLVDHGPRNALKVEVVSGCFLMARREAVDQIGLLDEDFFIYAEDIDWCKRFHLAGWDLALYSGAEAIHRDGASSSRSPVRFYVEMRKANLHYWEKHHGITGKTYYMILMFVHHFVRIVPRALEYAVRPRRRPSSAHKIERSVACIRWLLHM